MKKNLLFGFLFVCLGLSAQTVYNGNAKTGFGGTIGNGALSISDNGTDITFNLTTGGSFNDILVVYFDSKTGGFANTSTFNDQSDGGRKAVSGKSGDGTSNVNFPAGMNADYALAWGNFGSVLFELASGGNNSLVFINFNSSQTTLTIPKSAIGITGTIGFTLVGTYVAESAYRSNEALVENIGNGTEGGGNFGFNPITFNNAQVYPASVLNLDLKAFSAVSEGKNARINWQLACNSGAFADLNLQKSTNGIDFTSIYVERVTAARCEQPFEYTDVTATGGTTYYRLRYTSSDGETKTSNIARVQKELASTVSLQMVPTLVSSTANVQVTAPRGEVVRLRLVDMQGRILQSQQLVGTGAGQQVLVKMSDLPAGIYMMVATENSGAAKLVRFAKQ